MKTATILALLIGSNAMRLTDPTKTHRYPDAARILKLDPDTEFPDYPDGSIKQLDDGVCRSTDCDFKTTAKKVETKSEPSEVKASPVSEEAKKATTEAKAKTDKVAATKAK